MTLPALAIAETEEGAAVTPTLAPGLSSLARAELLADLRARIVAAAARAGRSADVVVGGSSVLALGLGAADVDGALLARLEGPASAPREHVIEVDYSGPDLDDVAGALGIRASAVVERHQHATYVALLTGFLPGFAYLGDLEPGLRLPRLARPRPRVAPGSVAIAGALTAIYPFASPGGWNLIGRALPAQLFDVERAEPALIRALDRVRFVAREALPVPAAQGAIAAPKTARPALVVSSVRGLVTVHDRGRFGLRAAGVPWSGPLDGETLARANAALGNPVDAAGIEVLGGRLLAIATAPLSISIDGRVPVALKEGDQVVVEATDKLTAYLAIACGVDVPLVLGSRSTLLVAGFGGFSGRALRAGDELGRCPGDVDFQPTPEPCPRTWERGEPAVLWLRRVPKDHRLEASSFDRLLELGCSVSPMLDRVGVRFDGGRLPARTGDSALPEPVLPGAIQVTTDGTLIALGPDSAVTGGYPIVAMLEPGSRALLGQLRPGQRVRFRER